MMIVAAGDLMLAWLVIPIVRNFESPDPRATMWLPLAIVGVFLLRGIGAFVSEFGMGWTGYRVVFDLRRDLIDKLLRLPTPYYDTHAAGSSVEDLVQRAPARIRRLRRAHQRDPVHAHDHGELRLPHVLNWRLTCARSSWGRSWHLIRTSAAACAHRARHPGPLGSLTQVLEELIGGHRVVRSSAARSTSATRGRARPTGCATR